MPVIAAIAAPVAAAFGGGVIGAVAAAVAVGAVTGAVIGAATTLISGGDLGDVFEGALKGAAIGGITAGVASGIGIATGIPALSAQAQMGMMGVPQATTAQVGAPPIEAGAGVATGFDPLAAVNLPVTPPAAPPIATGGLTGKDLIYAETARGAMGGLAEMGAARTGAKAAEEASIRSAVENKALLAQKESIEQARIAANVPGQFQAQVANIQVPNWWDKYVQTSADIEAYKQPVKGYQQGLLA